MADAVIKKTYAATEAFYQDQNDQNQEFVDRINERQEEADCVSTNTASKVVKRDASGNFAAGTITASLTGTASLATTATKATNIAGGLIGQIPYQAAVDDTDLLASVVADAGKPLVSGGAGAPSWGTGFLKKIGDTGWLAKVATDGWTFTFDEDAGTFPPLVQVYVADDDSGTNMRQAICANGAGISPSGIDVKSITSLNCRIQLANDYPFYGLSDVGAGLLDGGYTAPVFVRAIAFKIVA